MIASKRALTLEDMAEVARLSAESAEAEGRLSRGRANCGETMGWRLFTILRYLEAEDAVERLYSSDERPTPSAGASP